MMRPRVALGVLLLLPCADDVASAQEEKSIPSFGSAVELITVDAVVLDGNGRLVPGLSRADFVIKEDGRPQDIASFEAFNREEPGEEEKKAVPSVVATNLPLPRGAGRAFAIIVDDLRMRRDRSEVARAAVQAFLETSVSDADELVLGTTSGTIWWSARIPEGREDLLAVLSRVEGLEGGQYAADQMTDYEAFWISKYADSPNMGAGVAPGTGIGAGRTGGPEPLPAGLGDVRLRVVRRWANANLCTGPSCDGAVRGRAQEIDWRRKARTKATLESVRRALDAFAAMRGRKSLLLLSEGFVEDYGPELQEVVATSREANTAVYFLDVRGLLGQAGYGTASEAGPPPDMKDQSQMRFEEINLAAAGAESLADETGGFSVKSTNDLSAGLGRIADESRVYYLLGFHPPEGKSAREWRNLKVEVKRPGLRVRARRGYTLRGEAERAKAAERGKSKPGPVAPSRAVARALDSAHDAPGVPLRAMVYLREPRPKDTVHVLVVAELDARRLAPIPGDPKSAHLEVSVVAVNRDSGRGFRHDDTVLVPLDTADAPSWRAVVREFELPPGITQARVVVRDTTSGAVGSVARRFEVPASGRLRLATPVLTDSIAPATSPQQNPQPALAAHRVFRPQGGLYVQYEVLGAARDPDRGVPRVLAGLELWASGNRLMRKVEPTPIGADLDARVVRQVGIALDGMPEGSYDLVLDVRDEVTGARLKQREPFVLAADASERR
jgi:VWFA-related protein